MSSYKNNINNTDKLNNSNVNIEDNQDIEKNLNQKNTNNMNNTETKYISAIVVSVLVMIFVVCYSVVGRATQNISDMESEKRENEEQMSSYQEQASDLLETKSSLENLVAGLNSELAVIAERISEIENQITEKTNQLEMTEEELRQAKENEEKQYQDMKLRIKYMYEMENDSYIDIFFSGASIADTLNKAEYFSELVKYDRKMLERYKDTMRLIENKEAEYQAEQQELENLREEQARQQELVKNKIQSTNEQILLYAQDIAAAEAAALEYEKKVEANQLAIDDESRRMEESSIIEAESIARAKRERESREQASREQASIEESMRLAQLNNERETTSPQDDGTGSGNSIGESGENNGRNSNGGSNENGNNNENNSGEKGNRGSYVTQPNDVDMLAALIECEAGDQSYFGMLCVGAVVMNRINSASFPNTLYEVIYQPYQFTPVTVSGRFALVLARGADATCYKAAREILEDGNIVGTWLFFRMNDGSRQGEVIGDHVFY